MAGQQRLDPAAPGIGVQFGDTAEGEAARGKIEALLAGHAANKPTHTM